MSVLVIAEPGCTAKGDFSTMLRLLHTAKACGADAWKPQWTSNPQRMCERRNIGLDHPKRAYYERAYSWLAWPVEWHQRFRAECDALGMRYACTVFLQEDVPTVAPFVGYIKVASFEAADGALIDAAGATGKGVIASAGMSSECPQWRHPRMFWLHCVSAYPAPAESINLAVIYDAWCHGLSDHSRNVLTGAVAVGAGARIIEAHYRLDDCDPENPDYPAAFSPDEFAEYIRNIRTAEIMLGSGEKQIQECEREMLAYKVNA